MYRYTQISVMYQIPTVLSWSTADEVRPYTRFEETALFFSPAAREVILHSFGHAPPKLTRWHGEEIQRLSRFLEAMLDPARLAAWSPSRHPDNAPYQGLWLPLRAAAAPEAPAAARRRLLVTSKYDIHSIYLSIYLSGEKYLNT